MGGGGGLPLVDAAAADAPRRLVDSIRHTGFAVLTGHPLPAGLPVEVCAEWLEFFRTGRAAAYRHEPDGQEGYFPPPEPGPVALDRKEFFQLRRGGRYPAELSDAALRWFDAGLAYARVLLGWIERALPAPLPVPLPSTVDGPTGTLLRVQHYLPVPAGRPPGIRALAHTDINLVTLLAAPDRSGLQVRSGGGWVDVPAPAGALIVNAGEMLELLTGGYLPATEHRVVDPAAGEPTGSRLSLPLFVHPRGDLPVAPGRTAAGHLAARVAELRARGWAVAPGGGERAR